MAHISKGTREIDDDALDWVIRAGNPDFDDWAALQDWLEADPSHADRYHALALDVDEGATLVASAPAPPLLAERSQPRHGRRRWWTSGAIAASAATLVGFFVIDRMPDPFVVETAARATRTIRLDDGSTIAMNGATRLVLDRKNGRVATLERGEALFAVRHDAARPFRVRVGDSEVVDIGTAFVVVRDDGITRLGVSEGVVDFDHGRNAVRLTAGRGLTLSDAKGTIDVAAVDPNAVGAWRSGRLLYTGTPLRDVAADLSRSLGVTIGVAPEIAARRFRGTIALSGLGNDPSAIAPLLQVNMRRSGLGWIMTVDQ
jgi:transmembrane sensor